ncbi:chromosome alignment-maintaining phosphoprotein 1-like isoform X1 [Nerophis ophidion]|uniref:chromosome alignment-maintaining phosphoprotein 1-like isoform X1 n=2 Tax=Nerophis ophidion TaxID=159077 RepID=UPI002ADF30D8|nr:chromosome alignment-maintaining phosphoprotein 1-like isoform X1 [Nerophis ophidion]
MASVGGSQLRGEAGPHVAARLQCPLCGNFSKSHTHQLSHMASTHPTCLDDVAMGRLGNIIMYQSGAQLFHCADCFYTSRDFSKLYQHIIAQHCLDETAGGAADGEDNESEKAGGAADGEDNESEKAGGAADGEDNESEKAGGAADGEDNESEKAGGAADGEDNESEKAGGAADGEDNESEKAGGAADGEDNESEKAGGAADGEDNESEKAGGAADGEDNESEKGDKEGEEDVKGADEEDATAPVGKSSGEEEDGASQRLDSVKADGEADNTVLLFKKGVYHCLICSWKNKLKVQAISHVVRKHSIPQVYVVQRIKADTAAYTSPKHLSSGTEEEEEEKMSAALLKEEMEATAQVVQFTSNRYVCLICGWKTKMKGFVISHVVRCHDVQRPYSCKGCHSSFFLPSQLQQHVRAAHRPGRFICPFCGFRSHFLGGFRRHCSRCKEGEGVEGLAVEVWGQVETKATRAGRKRARRLIAEGEEEMM